MYATFITGCNKTIPKTGSISTDLIKLKKKLSNTIDEDIDKYLLDKTAEEYAKLDECFDVSDESNEIDDEEFSEHDIDEDDENDECDEQEEESTGNESRFLCYKFNENSVNKWEEIYGEKNVHPKCEMYVFIIKYDDANIDFDEELGNLHPFYW